MSFLHNLMQEAQLAWASYFPYLILSSMVLAFALRRVTRGMLQFTALVLLLFLALVAGSAIAGALGEPDIASLIHGLAIIIVGMLLIRQLGLAIFRLLIPRAGIHPPRILEEILILLAYLGWILLRLSQAGLDPGSLVASTAVITAVLAFAMQDTLGNILSGLALQLDHSIRIGDWIEIAENGATGNKAISGEIIQVQWRHTAVRTLHGEKILVPNSQLMKTQVVITGGGTVPRRMQSVVFYCDLHIPASSVIQAIEHDLRQAEFSTIAGTPAIECLLHEFANGVATYMVRYWLTDPRTPGSNASLVRQHIQAVFLRKGWEMAAPGMNLRWLSRQQDFPGPKWPDKLPDADRRAAILRNISLFGPLNENEIMSLAQRLQPLPFIAGSLLARQGEPGDSLYVIEKGHVAVWLESGNQRHLLAEVGPGEIVGEMSLMTGDRRRATLTARDNLVCYRLDKDSFQEVLQQRPELAEAFAQLLASRNQELVELQDNFPRKSVGAEQQAILSRIRRLFKV